MTFKKREKSMRQGAGIWLGIGVSVVLLALAAAAPAGAADIIAPQHVPHQADDGWQAGTCKLDAPTPCSVDTKAQWFEQASGHPPVGFTQIIVKHGAPGETPVGNLKTIRVDLPVGLSINPQATPAQCTVGAGQHPDSTTCAPTTQVGESQLTVSDALGVPLPLTVPVFNLVPSQGEPARFGFSLLGTDVYLEANIAWDSDYHEGFTIHAVNLEKEGLPLGPLGELLKVRLLKNRLVFNGQSGNGTFITTPGTCNNPAIPAFEHIYSTYLRADSYEEPDPSFPAGSPSIESPLPPGTMPKECNTIPFKPSVSVKPGSGQADSPDGPAVTVNVPFEPNPLTQGQSNLRTAKVSLPQGMGLNPSAANGLLACTDSQLGKGTTHPVACPPASKIGTVAIETPPLPNGSLNGNVYLGQQLSRDPASGQEYRIFVDAESPRYGISVRLIGNVSANPQTGQLTTTFAENPQVPFSSFRLQFDGGSKATLTSPPTCGPNKTTTQMTPWSGNAPATPEDGFTLTSAPGGGPCAKTLAARPFAPGFGAKSTNPKGGAYTHVVVDATRSDGNQELKGVDINLPPGLTAKLAGVRYCPEATIAAAAASSGAAEAANPTCPNSSLVGSAAVAAGSGSNPLHINGKVFLAGRYHGAPLSLAVITPATAGPFDLGTVVVRVALFVDPETARVRAVSDPIPHVFGGALLDLRAISVNLDRKDFALNPTNCAAMSTAGALRGGGANPLDPAAFSSFPVSVPFKVNGCENLDFKPKLFVRLFGGTRRAKSPKLRAVLVAREGDANIGRASVKLPKPLILEQSSLANVCTRVQFAANDCPKDSVYGFAEAYTPLLDGPLKGPVYLRSSSHELPDMVAALNGQVDIDLDGRIDSVKGRLRTTFDTVPDVPVSKFIVTVRGGKHGLLVNSTNLCAKKYRVIARFTGQNGKKANQRPKLRVPCKGKKGKKHRHRKH
jgi:hypothetical protein